jgi:hypothetical protein
MIDYESYKYVRNQINKSVERLKEALVYSVDKWEEFLYIRGKIQGLETLLQDLTDLQKKQELFDDDKDTKSGSTET